MFRLTRFLTLSLLIAASPWAGIAAAAEQKEAEENQVQPAQQIEETALGMNVTGNKELPNMLYIVPWQKKQANVSAPEIRPMLKEVFAPVDPDTFKRKIRLYQQLSPTQKEAAPVEQNKQ